MLHSSVSTVSSEIPLICTFSFESSPESDIAAAERISQKKQILHRHLVETK